MQATLDLLASEHPYPVLSRLRRLVSRDGNRTAPAE